MQFKRTWRRGEIIVFLETLESYLSAGLSLDVSLLMIERGSPKHAKSRYECMRSIIEKGGLFSVAFAESLKGNLVITSLIRHGEASGALVRSISLARSLLEHKDQLTKNCMSALAYPCIIGLFAILLIIGLVRGIMPQIIPMLIGLHVQLPILTRIVILCSDITTRYGFFILLGGSLLVYIFLFLYRRSRYFMFLCHTTLIHIPIVGKLATNYTISVFLHSCGALLESGVLVNRAYASTVDTISLLPLKVYMSSHSIHIQGGATMSSVFLNDLFPVYISALVSAGESSGTLATSCMHSAHMIDRDMQHKLKWLTSLIEPLMMVGMGLIIGAIALSILMPIYDISRVLQK